MRRRSLRWFWYAFFTVFAGAFISQALAGDKAEIVNIHAVREDPNLKVGLRIRSCFTPKMDEAIWSGVSTTFRIFIVLEEQGHFPFNPELLDLVLEHTIKYDRLKEEFRVSLSESSGEVRVTRRFMEAKQWMSQVEDLPVIPLWRLKKDRQYRLSVKAELSKVRLPFFLRYLFFFVSLWDFETDWNTKTFVF